MEEYRSRAVVSEAELQLVTALGEPVDKARLSAAVRDFTDASRHEGLPVERVIITLKTLIAQSHSPPIAHDLMTTSVTTCIKRYFEAGDLLGRATTH